MAAAIKAAQLKAAANLQNNAPMPPQDMRPGDWFCPVCSTHNYATRPKCFRCLQGINPAGRGGQAAGPPAGPAGLPVEMAAAAAGLAGLPGPGVSGTGLLALTAAAAAPGPPGAGGR